MEFKITGETSYCHSFKTGQIVEFVRLPYYKNKEMIELRGHLDGDANNHLITQCVKVTEIEKHSGFEDGVHYIESVEDLLNVTANLDFLGYKWQDGESMLDDNMIEVLSEDIDGGSLIKLYRSGRGSVTFGYARRGE